MTKERQKPGATRPLLAVAILIWLFLGASPAGQSTDPSLGVDLWQWAIERGGLTLTLLIVGWSYRNSLTKWADERVALEKRIADQEKAFAQAKFDEAVRYDRRLEEMLKATNSALLATSEAIGHHTTAMTMNTESSKMLTQTVRLLDQRLERVEHRE